MATLPHPPDLEVSDKWQHMAAFFVITTLGCAAYPRLPRLKLMLVMAAFGALIEIVQLIPMLHRDSDWHDWVADVIAVVIALGCFALYQRVAAPQQD